MRLALALMCCLPLAGASNAQLLEQNRLFDLRKMADTSLLYRGVVASRFGHETEGIELLRQFLQTNPSPKDARKALEELADAYNRLTRYKECADAWSEALRLTPAGDPDRKGNENSQALRASLANVAPQTVDIDAPSRIHATRNRLGTLDVPVRINDIENQWIFDTGANMSTLSESEAKRLGLAVFDSKAYVAGSTGARSPLRLAVASDLQLGSAHLHNVVFLVVADDLLAIKPLHVSIAGILGLPALRAFGRISASAEGDVEVFPHKPHATDNPNMFFDGESPIIEVSHENRHLQMFLDTGANTTSLNPSFRAAFTPLEIKSLRNGKEKTAGVGGILQHKTSRVPVLQLDLLEKPIELKNVTLKLEAPKGGDRYRDGVIGMDALQRGFVLDFDAMRMEVR